MSLEQWMYASNCIKPDETTLEAILEAARRHNKENGITGMLFYSGGRFLQVLEGECEAVRETYERIAKDPRHNDLVVLTRDKVEQRDFENWTMGMHKILAKDLENFPLFAPYFIVEPHGENIIARPGIAREMLKAFPP